MIIASSIETCNSSVAVAIPDARSQVQLHGILADPGLTVAVLKCGREFRLVNAAGLDLKCDLDLHQAWRQAERIARRRERARGVAVKDTDQLPRDDKAERLALGAIVAFPDCASEVFRKLHDGDFLDPAHRAIYRTMLTHRSRGMGVDPPLIGSELRGHREFPDGNASAYLVELGQNATPAHVAHYVDRVRQAAQKRSLLSIGESIVEGARNGKAPTEIVTTLRADLDDYERADVSDDPRFKVYSATELDKTTTETTFDIERLLVSGEPLALGAPEKHLKTTLMLAAGVSLNRVDKFLGHYQVNRRRDFLMFSGESSMGTIQETLRRICRASGCELSQLDGLNISSDLPQLDDLSDVAEFEAIVAHHAPDIVAVDPMMLCLGDVDEKAANMFHMGKLLRRLNEACRKNDATLLFAHHTSGVQQYGATPKLSWLAFSGFKQFVRQWWLLNRMEEYQPGSGIHRLKFVAGGSAGHNSVAILEINEGSREDSGGRRWQVAVKSVDEDRENEQQRQQEAKQQKAEKQLDADRKLVCQKLAGLPDRTETKGNISAAAGLGWPRFNPALASLIRDKMVIPTKVKRDNNQSYDAFALATK